MNLEWLRWGTGELSFLGEREARQECEQILEVLLGISRNELYLSAEASPSVSRKFFESVAARKKRIPLAYLLGKTFFWEDWFQVKEGVLIPRPETEILIEAFVNQSGFTKRDNFHFLDLGTGSGNIALTITKLFPFCSGVASDLSEKAIETAFSNAGEGVERLKFIQSDCLSSFNENVFDVIFSNPPYVASSEWAQLDPEVRTEPWLALDGGLDGLDFYRRILEDLSSLKKEGSLWVEIGWGQESSVRSLFEERFNQALIFKDYNQIGRVVAGIGFNGNG